METTSPTSISEQTRLYGVRLYLASGHFLTHAVEATSDTHATEIAEDMMERGGILPGSAQDDENQSTQDWRTIVFKSQAIQAVEIKRGVFAEQID